MFIDNIKIGSKLIGGFLIVACILGLVGWIGYQNMSDINDGMESMYTDRLVPIQDLGLANSNLLLIRGDLYKLVSVPDKLPDIQVSVDEEMAIVNDQIAKYKTSSLLESEKETLSSFEQNWEEYQLKVKEGIILAGQGRTNELRDSLSGGELNTLRKSMQEEFNTLIELNNQEAVSINTEAEMHFHDAVTLIQVASIAGFLIALGIGLFLTRSIIRPLNQTMTMIREMGLGHLGMRLSLSRKDEIGVLATTMDQFADDLQTGVIGTMQKIAAGDLTAQVVPKDEKDEISPALATTIASLRLLVDESVTLSKAAIDGRLQVRADVSRQHGDYRKIVEGVNATLDSFLETFVNPLNEGRRMAESFAIGDYTTRFDEGVAVTGDLVTFRDALNQIGVSNSDAIGGVKGEVETLSAGMEETSGSMQEVAASTSLLALSSGRVSSFAERSGDGLTQAMTAMEDLARAVSSVAEMAEQASGIAQKTVELSDKGAQLAGEAEKGMEGIMKSFSTTGSMVTDISKQMDEIGKIVGMITGIAEQTGLLALNAAIEAARAGDAGRGFAVVADEVKSLALESQKSAENIEIIIGALQKKTQQVTGAMKDSEAEVKSGNESVGETLNVFTEIVEAIGEVHHRMTQVASATEEQAASVEEITSSMNEVGAMVTQTAKEAMDSAAATEEVSGAVEQVNRIVADAANAVQRISGEMSRFTVS